MIVPNVPGANLANPAPKPSAKKWLGWLNKKFKFGNVGLFEVVITCTLNFKWLLIAV